MSVPSKLLLDFRAEVFPMKVSAGIVLAGKTQLRFTIHADVALSGFMLTTLMLKRAIGFKNEDDSALMGLLVLHVKLCEVKESSEPTKRLLDLRRRCLNLYPRSWRSLQTRYLHENFRGNWMQFSRFGDDSRPTVRTFFRILALACVGTNQLTDARHVENGRVDMRATCIELGSKRSENGFD